MKWACLKRRVSFVVMSAGTCIFTTFPSLFSFRSEISMFPNGSKMASAKSMIAAVGSIAGTIMLVSSVTRTLIPTQLKNFISLKIKTLIHAYSSELTITIEEYEGLNRNHLFNAVEIYLEPKVPENAKNLRLTMMRRDSTPSISLEKNEQVFDNFNGVKMKWRLITKSVQVVNQASRPDPHQATTREVRSFKLSFHNKHKKTVLDSYIPYVLKRSKELKAKNRTLKLFTLKDRMTVGRSGSWQSVYLDHPATFDTLAMDIDQKNSLMEDLERFVKRREYYRRVGKAWKRGYLLYGPPGTGKSSLIAAMANYLRFDIYDLELTEVRANSELRSLLISTGNKSILVVEDIDCSIELENRNKQSTAIGPQNQVTLSGFLNFIDGLWSSCGDERIIIFTTNHKEKLDPALLRPGRMDLHIHMSYCTPYGFKMLASRYLGTTEHFLFPHIEELIETIKVTPAEVGEQLMKSEEPDFVLHGFVEFLEQKKRDEIQLVAQKEIKQQENVNGVGNKKVSNFESNQGRS